jgi:hypothetical protein
MALCYNIDTIKKEVNKMKVYTDFDIRNFEPWSGAVDTYEKIADEDKLDELETLLEEIFFESEATETDINDLLWFDDEWLFECLGIEVED